MRRHNDHVSNLYIISVILVLIGGDLSPSRVSPCTIRIHIVIKPYSLGYHSVITYSLMDHVKYIVDRKVCESLIHILLVTSTCVYMYRADKF